MSFCLATSATNCNQQDPGQPRSTPMIFVTEIDVQSIRYTSNYIIWSHCGIVQHNKLTVSLKPQYSGIFSVSVHDQHAVALFGVYPADRGGAALVSALEHLLCVLDRKPNLGALRSTALLPQKQPEKATGSDPSFFSKEV
uniref:Uncharacterized protein n=1 Tax=Anopheles dirus TaxID=7168 RepID=A0A182NQ42_9DIPT